MCVAASGLFAAVSGVRNSLEAEIINAPDEVDPLFRLRRNRRAATHTIRCAATTHSGG